MRVRRHSPEMRLDAHATGERGRDPDRTAAIGAQRKRAEARDEGGDRTTGRAAWSAIEPPGVARDPGQRRIGRAAPAELRRGRLAEQYGPGFAQPGRDGSIVLPGSGRVDRAGTLEGRPATGVDEILDGRRYTIERADR